MKTLVLLFCVFGATLAQKYFRTAYQSPDVQDNTEIKRPIAILHQSTQFNHDGNFNYDFQSENGIRESAVGSVKDLGDKTAQVMTGHYAYTAPDGTPIEATWFADETGFHIRGAHLPIEPPMPEAIARSLEYIRTHPQPTEEAKH